MSIAPGTHLIYRSGIVRVYDYRCGHVHAGPCGEECAEAHTLVVPRRGIFRKRGTHGEVTADPGGAVFFSEGESYRIDHPIGGGDACTVFALHPGVLSDMLTSHGLHPKGSQRTAPFPAAQVPLEGREFLLPGRMSAGAPIDPNERLKMDEAVLNFCARVIVRAAAATSPRSANRRRPDTARARRQWVHEARAFLAARFAEPLSLGDVAKAVQCSPFHLSRVFRDETGVPLHQFLTRLRLRAALARLCENPCDLTTLALAVGFSSHSHLTRTFRQEFGFAPSCLRRGASRIPSIDASA